MFLPPLNLLNICPVIVQHLPYLHRRVPIVMYMTLSHEQNYYHADTPGVELAGRKAYWHHNAFDPEALQPDNNPKMPSIMQWAKAGSRFDFEVYFDNVTKTELEKLVYTLTFGENEEAGIYCHKIGHGKPLGFGSAKIIVDKIITRTTGKNDKDVVGYNLQPESLFAWTSAQPFGGQESNQNLKNIQKVANYNTVESNPIDYPRMRRGGAIYEWFSKNRRISDPGQYYQKLPLVSEPDQSLSESPQLARTQPSRSTQATTPQKQTFASPPTKTNERICSVCKKHKQTNSQGGIFICPDCKKKLLGE